MSDPDPNYEEMAALHTLGLLTPAEARDLQAVARRDPAVRRLIEAFEETSSYLAADAPAIEPPAEVRRQILRSLPSGAQDASKFSRWFPFAIAACLMIVGLTEAVEIFHLTGDRRDLQNQLAISTADGSRLRESNALLHLRLAELDTKNPSYSAAKILVAWDGTQHRGTLAVRDLPAAPAGQVYQLWVLDPNAAVPVSAGLLTVSRRFEVGAVSVANPGFAISLEPAGGSRAPTGPILFAVAPAE